MSYLRESLSVLSDASSNRRTLGERFAGVINVKDYGATGDGATDDTSSFDSALSAVATGGRLVVPEGTYVLGVWTIAKAVTVSVEPGASLKLKAGTDDHMIEITAADVTFLGHGLAVMDGNDANNTFSGSNGVMNIQADRCRVEGVTFDDCERCVYLKAADTCVIASCRFQSSALGLFAHGDCDDLRVQDCDFVGVVGSACKIHGHDGVTLTQTSERARVGGCLFDYSSVTLTGTTLAVELWGGASATDGCPDSLVVGCVVRGPANNGGNSFFAYSIDNSDRTIVSDCYAINDAGGSVNFGFEAAGSNDMTFDSCYGIDVDRGVSISQANSNRVRVSGCYIYRAATFGIQLLNSGEDCKIQDCYLEDCASNAINFNAAGSGGTVRGCRLRITSSGSNGMKISLGGSVDGVTIEGCWLKSENASHNATVTLGGKYCIITGNTFLSMGGSAALCSATNATQGSSVVSGNIFRDGGGRSIEFRSNGSGRNLVTDNIFHNMASPPRGQDNDIFLNVVANIGLTASTTQSQGEMQLHSRDVFVVAVVANADDVVTMPSAQGAPGMRKSCTIINRGANQLQIFPKSGEDIEGGATDASTTLAAGSAQTWTSISDTSWEKQ